MATAATHDIKKKLAGITECVVCCETFRDPRQLPCIHTFCMDCIRGFSGAERVGGDVPCPLCRIQFKVPESGVDGLPKNFFVEQLKEIVHPLSIHCEVCRKKAATTTRLGLCGSVIRDCPRLRHCRLQQRQVTLHIYQRPSLRLRSPTCRASYMENTTGLSGGREALVPR